MLRNSLMSAGLLIAILLAAESAALLFMKSSVTRYAQYWKARAAESPAGDIKPFIYVALGDSTAQGIGATSAAKGYVGLLAVDIARAAGRPVRVINLSKTGATIGDVLDRQLPELAALKVTPELLTMEIGANDLPAYDEASFRTDYGRVLEQLATLPPGKTVVSDMPYFGGRIKVHGADLAASQVIRGLAAQRDIAVAPLYDSLKSHDSLRIYAADYFHPSNHGYTIWRDAFWQKIQPLIRR